MEATNGQVTIPAGGVGSSCQGAGQSSPGWLAGWRGLVVWVAAATAAVALALSQHWVAVADLLPLLVVLPCAVMMLSCMKGMNRGQQTNTAQTSPQNVVPTLPTSESVSDRAS
jgi:DUF2933 family protein